MALQKSLQTLCYVLTLLMLASSGPATGQEVSEGPDKDATVLDPITVNPQASPLDDSLNRLRRMLNESAPCLGCGALPPRRSLAESIAHFISENSLPPNPDFAERREDRILNDWRKQEWGPEMEDFK